MTIFDQFWLSKLEHASCYGSQYGTHFPLVTPPSLSYAHGL